MRYYEIQTGIRTVATNEESELINLIHKAKKIANEDLNYREQEVARKLVSRGLLERIEQDDKTFFIFNSGEY